jgi:hypothetical protein
MAEEGAMSGMTVAEASIAVSEAKIAALRVTSKLIDSADRARCLPSTILTVMAQRPHLHGARAYPLEVSRGGQSLAQWGKRARHGAI